MAAIAIHRDTDLCNTYVVAVGSGIWPVLNFLKTPGINVVQECVYRPAGTPVLVPQVGEKLRENLFPHGIPVFHRPGFSVWEPPNDGTLFVDRVFLVGQNLVQYRGKVGNEYLRDWKRGSRSNLGRAVDLGRV